MKKEERRQQIIDRAMEVFIKCGYKGATTAKLAEEIGVAEVTLFRYFSSKQELFLAGVEPIFVESLRASLSDIRDCNDEEKIRQLLYERLQFISENHALIQLILQEKEFLRQAGEKNFLDMMIASFKKFIKDLPLARDKEDLVLRLLMGSILSFLYMPEKKPAHVEEYVDQLTKLLVQFIQQH
ncbi:MAG TPA: hypothetical protein DHN33_09255 [Eubacteriaceae bacterium]|nr:hypothetical protein [Eubacteriaceae bacterium]